MFETPGAANMTIETLSRIAAAFKVGLEVRFVPMSEMLRWENQYSQDTFTVVPLDNDYEFIDPDAAWREESYTRNAGGASQVGDQIGSPLPLKSMPGMGTLSSQNSTIGSQMGASAA